MLQVKPLNDKEEILAFLEQDRLYAAYAIGDLEPGLFAHCQWFGAEDGETMHALALFFTGLQMPALFTMGDAEGVAAILDSALQPKRAYFTCRAEHLPVVEAAYALNEVEEMFRMAIAPADFQRVPGPTIKLDLSHLKALRQLYRLGGGNAFAPYQLRNGVYYGVEAGGQLVSVAGTHLVSPTFGVAAVGNIFTHPDYRRRGYGTACTGQVVQELLAQGLDIVLNVNRQNTGAIRIYERLGFRKHCPYIEVIGHRKYLPIYQSTNIQTKEEQMRNIILESLSRIPVEEQRVELVERKGVGHPDSICDAIMDAISVELCRAYLDTFGRILHHNIDKGLLVAGRTTPRLGGGTVEEPMRLVFGDRAIYEMQGKRVPVADIAEATAKAWLRSNLRFVDVEKHIVFQNEIKPGSPELTDIFEREVIGANDTSAGVGYAPLTETEELVLATERYLNSTAFKATYPEVGEDIKVMGYRHDHELVLTIAIAFVDRFIPTEEAYFEHRAAIQADVEDFVARRERTIKEVTVNINTLDVPGRGEGGMYLTVLGTSAEGADCGQVGRGNKVNGVIALNRPMTTEAAAGKNPVSHVGKIYNLLSHKIAEHVYASVPGIREVYIWLCSQIGHPIDRPLIASAQLILEPGLELEPIRGDVEAVIENELANIYDFTDRLAQGEFTVW